MYHHSNDLNCHNQINKVIFVTEVKFHKLKLVSASITIVRNNVKESRSLNCENRSYC